MKEQQNNKTTNHILWFGGLQKTMKLWSEELGVNYSTFKGWVYRGMSIGDIISYSSEYRVRSRSVS